jgi:hypothetical protein
VFDFKRIKSFDFIRHYLHSTGSALSAPAAIGDLAVIGCWRVPGADGGRPAAGGCLGVVLASAGSASAAAAVDLVLQLKEAPAGRRAGGAGGRAAGDGRGRRRAERAGGDRGSGGDQVLACARRRRRPASSRRVPGRGAGQRRHRGAPVARARRPPSTWCCS